MSKGKFSGGRQFKPGWKGGPGRPKNSGLVAPVRRLTQVQVAEFGTIILNSDIEQLKEIAKNPKETTLRVMLASIAIKALSKGDHNCFNAILDRVLGKSKEFIEVTGVNEGPIQLAATLSEAELEERTKKLFERLSSRMNDKG